MKLRFVLTFTFIFNSLNAIIYNQFEKIQPPSKNMLEKNLNACNFVARNSTYQQNHNKYHQYNQSTQALKTGCSKYSGEENLQSQSNITNHLSRNKNYSGGTFLKHTPYVKQSQQNPTILNSLSFVSIETNHLFTNFNHQFFHNCHNVPPHPPISNFFSGGFLLSNEKISRANSKNVSVNKTSQKINHPLQKSQILLVVERITPKIYNTLYYLWRNKAKILILKSIDETSKNIDNSTNINIWNKLEPNTGMFHKDISMNIEFHKSLKFENITVFRKKIYKNYREFHFNYLVVKGEPEKDFKNLYWEGDNIFIMDSSGIGQDIFIFKYSYIGPGCKIGDGVHIHRNCFLEKDVEIEKNSFIGRNNFFGQGCKVAIKNEENRVLWENSAHELKLIDDGSFKTIVGSFNSFCQNIIVPYGVDVGSYNFYYYRSLVN